MDFIMKKKNLKIFGFETKREFIFQFFKKSFRLHFNNFGDFRKTSKTLSIKKNFISSIIITVLNWDFSLTCVLNSFCFSQRKKILRLKSLQRKIFFKKESLKRKPWFSSFFSNSTIENQHFSSFILKYWLLFGESELISVLLIHKTNHC